jgi:hypothetical protein
LSLHRLSDPDRCTRTNEKSHHAHFVTELRPDGVCTGKAKRAKAFCLKRSSTLRHQAILNGSISSLDPRSFPAAVVFAMISTARSNSQSR